MKTKNEFFHITCGMLDAFDIMAYNLRERRRETLEELCELMNDIFITGIQEKGIRNVHFCVEDFKCGADLVLRFEEKYSRKDFLRSEEEWMVYRSNNIRICDEYLKKINSDLHVICLPMDEDET